MTLEDFFIGKSDIEGMDQDIITDLYNIVEKFGKIDQEDQIVRFVSGDLGLGYKLSIATSINGDRMLVRKLDMDTNQEMKLARTIKGDIFWDGSLIVEDIKKAVEKIYQLGDSACEDYIHGKYITDKIFSSPGTGFIVPPGKDPQNLLNRFDHPEKLIVIRGPFGYIVQRKDHLSYLKRRAEMIMQICKEQNIDLNDIGKLSFSDVLDMRREIEKRMDK